MPIYVKQSSKLGDINHRSKDMGKVYGKDMLVFQHYVKAGTIIFNNGKPTGFGDSFSGIAHVHDSHGNVIVANVEYAGLEETTITMPVSINQIKNGIRIYANYFLVEPEGEQDLDELGISGVDNSDSIDTTFPCDISISELKAGTEYFHASMYDESQSLSIKVKGTHTLELLSNLDYGTHFVDERYATGTGSLPTYLLIDRIEAY